MIIGLTSFSQRLSDLRHSIDELCLSSGRSLSDVQLIAVSKKQDGRSIREAYAAGQRSFGENYAQEYLQKNAELSDLTDIEWHFIGHLQTNKAKLVVGTAKSIQSVDSFKLAAKISELAVVGDFVQPVLVEVNLTGDPGRYGVSIEQARQLCDQICELSGVQLTGLMGIAPLPNGDLESNVRPAFSKLKSLFDKLPLQNRKTLSMGMSIDYKIAIEEGSTMIRIGTALFGPRN